MNRFRMPATLALKLIAILLFAASLVSAQRADSGVPRSSGRKPGENSPGPKGSGPPRQLEAAESAWSSLRQNHLSIDSASEPDLSSPPSSRKNELAQAKSARFLKLVSLADQAQEFHQKHRAHSRAAEARKMEVFSLIRIRDEGDSSLNPRLASLVRAVIRDEKTPKNIKSQVVAAEAFSRDARSQKKFTERLGAMERISRDLVRDYPEQREGYQAMLVIAQASESTKRVNIATEVLNSSAPAEFKRKAQLILDRHSLVGRSLVDVLRGSKIEQVLADHPADAPLLIYSWAGWGPNSIKLGRMIQARRFAAIGICLDENPLAARKVRHDANLGGKHVYDENGLNGAIASQLHFNTTGQIYVVDQDGVIRDVNGGHNLEAKLQRYGFQTPPVFP